MQSPGSITNSVPDPDKAIRLQRDVQRTAEENISSVAASFATTVAELTAQVANLAARVTQTATIPSFNTGNLPNDSTFHNYGSSFSITIAVPTGKIVVTIGCGQATITPSSTGSVTAEATFSLSDGSVNYGDISARDYAAASSYQSGSSLAVQQAFTVASGTITITGQMRAWASGSTTGQVEFQEPYLTVQVTG